MTDLVNDIAFIARGIDKLKQIDKSIVSHASEGMKFKDLISVAADDFNSAESLLDAIARLDNCNGSGVFGGTGLASMRSLANLIKAIKSTSLTSDISSLLSGNASGILKDAAGILLGSSAQNLIQSVQSAISAIGSVQSIISTAVGEISDLSDFINDISLEAQKIEQDLEGMSINLIAALEAALCSAACGPSNGSGLPGSPLAALAALAGLDIAQLTGISDLATMFSQISAAAASIKSGGNFNGFSQYCLQNLTNKIIGNSNPCQLLGLAIAIISEMADEDAYVGHKTFTINIKIPSEINAFSTAMKLLEMIKKLMGAISAARNALTASVALAEAMACSGYTTPVAQTTPVAIVNPNIKGNQGGPGGLGGPVGGQSGADIIANATSISSVSASGRLYANVFYSNAMNILPSNIVRNNSINSLNNSITQASIDVSYANSIALTSNTLVMQYTTSGNSVSTNIPRKTV